MQIPRLVIAGSRSGVGKTTITLGIMAALSQRNLKVAPYKVGPDFIDPGLHSLVTGTASRNLDLWLLEEETVLYLLQKNSELQDISIIEGVMGLYDGRGTKSEASTAHLAKVVDAPVVLVVDGSGVAASIAAQVLGYKLYDPELRLAGVIVNRVSGEAHYQLLRTVIERDVNLPCFGYLKKTDQIHLQSRHLGLIPGIEVRGLAGQTKQLVELVEETIDLDALVALADSAEEMKSTLNSRSAVNQMNSMVRIGLARDEAFHFYYQDNLDLLREMGAELVEFSPLVDGKLPEELDGLYIGGGFPEIFASQLMNNHGMRSALAEAVGEGVPTYAECGGMMYLTRGIENLEGERFEMVGVIPAVSLMTEKLQRFGYVEVEFAQNIFDLKGVKIPAHEFHYSRLVTDEACELNYTYQVKRKDRSWDCGIGLDNLLAGYPHLHFYSNLRIAEALLARCRKYQDLKKR